MVLSSFGKGAQWLRTRLKENKRELCYRFATGLPPPFGLRGFLVTITGCGLQAAIPQNAGAKLPPELFPVANGPKKAPPSLCAFAVMEPADAKISALGIKIASRK